MERYEDPNKRFIFSEKGADSNGKEVDDNPEYYHLKEYQVNRGKLSQTKS